MRRWPSVGGLLLAVCLALIAVPRAAGAPVLEPQEADPLHNLVARQPITLYQEWQGAANDTLACLIIHAEVRLSGARFVPFAIGDQRLVMQAFQDTILPTAGFVQFTSYREFQPDLAAPQKMQEASPGVDICFDFYYVLNQTMMGQGMRPLWDTLRIPAYGAITNWARQVQGKWPSDVSLRLVNSVYGNGRFTGGFILHPLVVMNATLEVTLGSGHSSLSAEQASAVGQALEDALMAGGIGTLVEVVGYAGSEGLAKPGNGTSDGTTATSQGRPAVQLEVTLYACRNNATVETPECERQILQAVLARLGQSPEVQQRWQVAGINGVAATAAISLRQPPALLTSDQVAARPDPWVPWHLDRIDQRTLPLDGKFTADGTGPNTTTATGTGVNVYIISSGVLGNHEEFGYINQAPGVRVKPAWGYLGLDPMQDCRDYANLYGFGTFAGSLCCGRQLGAAKNATIHSVRFRETCADDPVYWSEGALPSAMDLVLSTYVEPAVLLIDTWWSPTRIADNAAVITEAIMFRLKRFNETNITVIAPAGPGFGVAGACDNIIGSHENVISVAASDTHDQATAFGPSDSPCIDIFAPSGGLGIGMLGASPAARDSYTRVVNRAFGAAAVVAGAAAQYLQLHRNARPQEVKTALLEMATKNVVTDAGQAPMTLLYTDLTQPYVEPVYIEPVTTDGIGGGLSTGATVSIAIVASLVAIGLVAVGLVLMARRKRQLHGNQSSKSLHGVTSSGGWEVSAEDLEICRHPDGSEWLLGEGRYGRVYKALKGGVQVVAVKKLIHVGDQFKAMLIKEIDMMKYVSRDANVTQFYGACVQGDNLMLVAEYMEGGDLRDALSSSSTCKLQWYQRGKDVMLDVVRGVHFLHANQLVHRDINSKNILLGRDGRAKLSDVGLAQLLGSRDLTKLKDTKRPSWTAPEVLAGEKSSEKADIYALGVVLWELVTLQVPLVGGLRDPEVPRECPQEVADAIKDCLQREPSRRPSARDLYSRLLACPSSGDFEAVPVRAAGSCESDVASACGSKELQGSRDCGEGSGSNLKLGSDSSRRQLSSSTGLGSPLSLADITLVTIDFDKVEFCLNPDGSKQRLGNGSYGQVYKVMLDGVQLLAAKVMPLGNDPAVHAAFLKEAELMWRLRHRNVVGLSSVSIHNDQGFLLMELMEGSSLYKMLNTVSKSTRQRVFAWHNRGKQIALDIARGIHYLHSMRITHFDLKSGNILLTRELTAKVSDVGLARVMSCTHHSICTEEGSSGPPGTLAYMAPELMAGNKCTQSVDIYSFGVLLWEIASGVHPVRNCMEPLRVPEDCPQAIADLYLQCTSADPAARPTAREVVERLTLAMLPPS